MATFHLRKTQQCKLCPWRVETDPRAIPNGYSVAAHRRLGETTIAREYMRPTNNMACHETEDAECIGWLHNQLGTGNNIPLRIRMRDCLNVGDIQLRGEQHATFADTLPKRKRRHA